MKWREGYALLLLASAGCGRRWGPPPDINGLEQVNGEQETVQLGNQVRRLLEDGQWDSLDQLARSLRASDARFSDGTSQLRVFYAEGTGRVSNEVNDLAWINQIRQLKAWVVARPQSMAARVGLAYGLHGYAWDARGTGWAKDIPDSARALMAARLTEAGTVLAEARSVPEECPGWYQVALRLANVSGADQATFEGLYQAGVAKYPDYDALIEYKANHLLPRWGGKPGELEAFAAVVANRRGGSAGDELYARIAWHLADNIGADALFHDQKLSWPRIRSGYAALTSRYPQSFYLSSQAARLAYAAGERAEAKAWMQRLGRRVDLAVWNSREAFAIAQEDLQLSATP